MGFDAQAFATAFLEGQAADIKERFKEAKTESDRRKELARTAGMTQYRKRKALAAKYLQWANSLRSKGMDDENLSYLASNPSALATVFDSVNKFEQEHGRSMKANRLNELITLTNDYASPVDDNGNALDLPQQIEKAAGLYMQNYTPDPQQDEDNMLQSVFGFNAKDRIDAQLRERTEIDNLTTYDLYQMGTTGDYTPDEMANININYSELPSAPSDFEKNAMVDRYKDLLKIAAIKDYNAVFNIVSTFKDAQEARDANIADSSVGITQHQLNLYELGSKVQQGDLESKVLSAYTTDQLSEIYGTQAMVQLADLFPAWESNDLLRATASDQFDEASNTIQQRRGLPVISGTSAEDYNASIDVLIREDKLKAGSKVYLKDLYMTAEVTDEDEARAKGTKDVLPSSRIGGAGDYPNLSDTDDDTEITDDEAEDETDVTNLNNYPLSPASNFQSIFDDTTVERKKGGGVQKKFIATLPDLTDAQKEALSKHAQNIRTEYNFMRTYESEDGKKPYRRLKGVEYKGVLYRSFSKFMLSRLKEEYPNTNETILLKIVSEYGK